MSQSLSLNNYHKRKYITSPKKSYFKARGNNSSIKTRSPQVKDGLKVEKNGNILRYFSPTSEAKRIRITPENEVENGASPTKNLSVRKDLFDAKNGAIPLFDQKNIIVLTDDDEDDALTLVFNRGNKKLSKSPDVKQKPSGIKSVIGGESSKKSLHILKETVNPKIASCSKIAKFKEKVGKLDLGVEIKSEKLAYCVESQERSKAKPKLELEVELKREIDNEVKNLLKINVDVPVKAGTDVDSQACFTSEIISETKEKIKLDIQALESETTSTSYYDSVTQEVVVFPRTPAKSTGNSVQIRRDETFISPGKSVVNLKDIVESVRDVNWWEDEDFQLATSSKACSEIKMKNKLTDATQVNNVDGRRGEQNVSGNAGTDNTKNRSKNVNNKENNDARTSSGDDKRENSCKLKADHRLKSDLINYIVTTPPASMAWQTIFTHSQYQNIYKNYIALPVEEKLLYSRLFQRKYDWIRLDKIDYGFIVDKKISLNVLAAVGFIKYFDIENEDLSETLKQMKLDELKRACDIMKVKKGRQADMIQNILNEFKSQPILRFCNPPPVNKNKSRIKAVLPQLIKLAEAPRKLFNSFLLISSYAQYKSRDDDRMKIIVDLLYRLENGQIKELDVPLLPVPVFKSLAKFHEYEASIELVDGLLKAKKEKEWSVAKELVLKAKSDLKVYLGNELNICDLEVMPDYLRKYTAGANHVYALSEGIEVLKKDRNASATNEVIECIQLLLSQSYFSKGKRASWRCELALVLERCKQYDQVFLTLKDGLVEEHLSPLGKTLLVQRCEMLIKKKHGLSVPQKNDLAVLSEMQPYRFTKNTITASEMPNVSTSNKQMWKRETADGQEIMGVEQIVLHRYRSSEGSYSDGCHDEGNIMVNLVLCAFWSEIYAPLEGMFHVRLQRQPIDWSASAFYRNRAQLIKDKIEVYKQSGIEGIMSAITQVVVQYSGTLSLISWDLLKVERLPDVQKFLSCVGVEPFLRFSEYLLQSYRERCSGLPDLTLWNVNTMKCLFVEVKGPTDKLSPKQIHWLQKLNEFGITAEVCHVRTLHTGKRGSD